MLPRCIIVHCSDDRQEDHSNGSQNVESNEVGQQQELRHQGQGHRPDQHVPHTPPLCVWAGQHRFDSSRRGQGREGAVGGHRDVRVPDQEPLKACVEATGIRWVRELMAAQFAIHLQQKDINRIKNISILIHQAMITWQIIQSMMRASLDILLNQWSSQVRSNYQIQWGHQRVDIYICTWCWWKGIWG